MTRLHIVSRFIVKNSLLVYQQHLLFTMIENCDTCIKLDKSKELYSKIPYNSNNLINIMNYFYIGFCTNGTTYLIKVSLFYQYK